jgi:hypothetical protein
MNQALYAQMNNKRKMKKKMVIRLHIEIWGISKGSTKGG